MQLFGSKRGGSDRFFSDLGDGTEYDNLFIFDEVGWNFEPSELSAAFGLQQLDKLPGNLDRRKRNHRRLCQHFRTRPDVFVLPRTTAELDTAWHMFPVLIRKGSGVDRSAFQQHMEAQGVDTRMVWTGNLSRQPAFRNASLRLPPAGLPHADRVMDEGLVLPSSHALHDDDIDYIWEVAASFLAGVT